MVPRQTKNKLECFTLEMRYKIYWLLKCQLFYCAFSWNLVYGQIRYSIPEELQLGAFVGNIAADLGLDIKQLSARSLQIAPGPRNQYVDVNLNNGIFVVKERIDREQLCGRSLTCVLSLDVMLENPLSLHQVSVEILDVNDNAPNFAKRQLRLEISELSAPGARFPLESAHDPDIGQNSLQTYDLLPNKYFILDVQIRSRKGKLPVLVLEKSLDRETQSTYTLTLTAKDGGTPVRSGTVYVIIIVKDANDHAPVFSQSVYRTSLMENASRGTLIITLNATDLDDGPNGEIVYSFSSHSSARARQLFSVDSKTGEIRVKGNLDYEESSAFEINIQAMDKGSDAMSGHCDVLVDIIDVNDNAPEVTVRTLSSTVSEDAPVGTVVALFSAADKDSGQNGDIQCQVSKNMPFKLDSSMKNYYRLLIQHLLDREDTSRYDVTITCTDAGNPPLTSKKIIRVEVSDINDNVPKFTQHMHTANVMENNAIGTSIFSLSAFDADVGQNARLKYSILESQDQNVSVPAYVTINSETGVIYSQKAFDYELLKAFHFQAQVMDSGTPPLASNVSVNVIVLDQNDNVPMIVHPLAEYGLTVTETISRFAEPGYLVAKVSATDADAGQNARLSYSIFQATQHNLFTISLDTGEIWTIRRIENEDASKQRLVIAVEDNGTPSLSATVTIILTVVGTEAELLSDVNILSETPVFTPDLSISLVIVLGISSAIFLVILIVLAAKVNRSRSDLGGQHCSLHVCCCFGARRSMNGIQKASRNLEIPPNYVEVFGGDPLSQSFRYESCSTLQSTKRDFKTPNACGPSPTKCKIQNMSTGKDISVLMNYEKYSNIISNEVKQPNADWHFAQTHRAELNSAQYLEEEGVQREIQREVQREVQCDVQREVPRDVQCDVPHNIQREVQRDVQCDMQRVVEKDPGGPRKPMCARPVAIPAGRDGWTLPRTAPRMQLQMTLGAHVPGTLRSQYLIPRELHTSGARISNSSVEFSAPLIGSLHGPMAANQTRDHRGISSPGSRRPELDPQARGEIPCSPTGQRLSTQRLHSRDHDHALREVNY
ncbi:protocadherin beta-15-like isoform X4 [Scyliorhinus canicula]|uniref:protocadherin beta-15-like isoform X4 n=1 Tax=Scyliorhinus canicula TaxID=7830 RepID=UPI0018F3CFFC|nr:protocadherin beta-15-like isoform X4 [Scyliorhinus canicula]